jgi:origin recognition complex subunit 3
MSHFYGNPLSVLNDRERDPKASLKLLQPEHLKALRMLPSFTALVEILIEKGDVISARGLLEDEKVLLTEVDKSLDAFPRLIRTLLRTLHILSKAVSGPIEKIDLYIKAFRGTLNDSDAVQGVLDSIKRMDPAELGTFIERIVQAMEGGSPELDLEGWLAAEHETAVALASFQEEANSIAEQSEENGTAVRSKYAINSQGLRTTVIAQRVQLSYQKSTLSKLDLQYTALIDRVSNFFQKYFVFEDPSAVFLNEVWIYDYLSPYSYAFTPRPRFTIEQALSTPSDYMRSCIDSSETLSAANPTTAILYQMYLESGSLINVSDMWNAFYSIIGGDDAEGHDERTALMLFYRGLADLGLLGMVKQSKKKVDHLAKSAWRGL